MRTDKYSELPSDYPEEYGFREEPNILGSINIPDLVIRKWRYLLAITAAGAVISVTVVLLLPPLYRATAVILPPQKQQSISSAMMGQLGAMAGVFGPSLGLKDPADLQVGILKSRTINEKLIDRFDLMNAYEAETKTDALKKLADRTGFTVGRDSLIRITADDRDPKRAAAMANAYVEELFHQNNRLALTEAAQRRLFFERALQEEKTALAKAEENLKETQARTGAVQMTAQAEGLIKLVAQLRAEVAAREVMLQRLKLGATTENPEVRRQESDIAAMRAQLRRLEAGGGRTGGPIIPFGDVPEAGLATLRTLREFKYHETLFEVLAKQYEAARIDEAKESQAIQVVDIAVPPEKKHWPPRALLSILGTLISAFLTFGYFIVAEAWAQRQRRKGESTLPHNHVGDTEITVSG